MNWACSSILTLNSNLVKDYLSKSFLQRIFVLREENTKTHNPLLQ